MITAVEINLVFILETPSTAEKFFFLTVFFQKTTQVKKSYPGKNDLIIHTLKVYFYFRALMVLSVENCPFLEPPREHQWDVELSLSTSSACSPDCFRGALHCEWFLQIQLADPNFFCKCI